MCVASSVVYLNRSEAHSILRRLVLWVGPGILRDVGLRYELLWVCVSCRGSFMRLSSIVSRGAGSSGTIGFCCWL